MDPGDLVRILDKGTAASKACSDGAMGIVLEVRHPRVSHPDYRTPSAILVYFPDEKIQWSERWFHKQELKIVNSR